MARVRKRKRYPGIAPRPASHRYREQYGVIVICKDEAAQRRTYERLRELGLDCRVVCT